MKSKVPSWFFAKSLSQTLEIIKISKSVCGSGLKIFSRHLSVETSTTFEKKSIKPVISILLEEVTAF